jgi:hypothetical protein
MFDPAAMTKLAEDAQYAKDTLDAAMKEAIESDTSFTKIARAIGKTEAAVRMKAVRLGWYKSGTRRRTF